MNLLTDEERDACLSNPSMHIQARIIYRDFARAIEAAFLAKLASAELPDATCQRKGDFFDVDAPTEYEQSLGWEPLYTADQLRQAYAQGAAAQLSAEPIGEFEALPDPTVGEIPWLNIYNAKSRVIGTKLYTRREA